MSHGVIIKDAVKRYGDFTALKGVNLEIKQGEFFTLLGPSGCGKTTLLRMIAGFNSVDGGEICFDDKVINNLEAHKRDIGMVFQNYAIFPHLTVAENVAYGLKAKKYPKDQIPGKVEEALDLVQIKNLKDRKPNELSGGQQQRVALARAFVIEPGVLLMDEPLSNLDAKLRVQMRTVIKKLQRRLGITTIYVTHDQIEAMTVGQRIALMHEGKMQMLDTPANVYNRPANVFTAKFIGSPSMNIVEASYTRGTLVIGRQVVWLPDMWSGLASRNESGRLFLGIRPEHMILHRRRQENTLEGTVKYVEDYGNRYGVYVQVDNMEIIAVSEGDVPAPGESVYIQPDFDRIHLFDRATQVSLGYPDQLRAAREPYILQKGTRKKGENDHGFAHQYQYV